MTCERAGSHKAVNLKRTWQLGLLWVFMPIGSLWAQTAQLGGRIQDPSGSPVDNAVVTVLNEETGIQRTTTSNFQGQYLIVSLPPSRYRVTVEATGFQATTRSGLILEVGQNAQLDFSLQIRSIQQTVTVEGGTTLINSADASVSTVISRDFVANLPLNGRSFHSLVELTPGTVLVNTTEQSRGQFAINGQRNDANYFTVDGVSANIGVGSAQTIGQGGAGSTVGATVFGGTNGLVSIDALQEFRILTSTYAPEYGRTPGGQIAVITRAGTNNYHGVLFDYFRNDKLDAADWFGNRAGLPKAAARQNDFGGVFGGPLVKDRTFFFFSYEGLRLRQPATVVQDVPSLSLRQSAPAAIQPYLKLFPLPTLPDSVNAQGRLTGYAQGVYSVSSPTTFDAASIRLDHSLGRRFQLFGRYNFAPSIADNRGGGLSVNSIFRFDSRIQTITGGLVTILNPRMTNDLRFNLSMAEGFRHFLWDNYGGGTPLPDSAVFPAGYSGDDSIFGFRLTNGVLANVMYGNLARNFTRQYNVVDSYSLVKRAHQLKLGLDWRRLRVRTRNSRFQYQPSFNDTGVLTATPANGTALSGVGSATLARNEPAGLFFDSWSFYAQDTWKAGAKLTLTYGFRWDVNPPPSPEALYVFALTNVGNPSNLGVAPVGTPLYRTRYGNFAPRAGLAYQVTRGPSWMTVLRTGTGLFYDTAFGRLSNYLTTPPFSSFVTVTNVPIPVPFSQALITIPTAPPLTGFTGVDPNLKLPRTWHWNVSIEQQLGAAQTLTVSYVGAKGIDLFVGEQFQNLNATFLNVTIIGDNNSNSSYNAFQAQYQRRFSRALQAMASYTWSHSIDTASSDVANFMHAPDYYPNQNRGNSDFDIRQLLTVAIVYQIPKPKFGGRAGAAVLGGWGIDPLLRFRTATPIDILATRSVPQNFQTRLNYVSGQPFYIYDPVLPGGRRFNAAAWTLPVGFVQGTFGRNVVRGFSFRQADLSLHRSFRLADRFRLTLRSDFFNVTNHPSFANPSGTYNTGTTFGVPTAMLGKGLNSASAGGFNALYQIGGPRSIQLSLKLSF